MEAMRESWTDDRLDDLANRMDGGFARVDTDIRELRAELKAGFDRVDDEFKAVRAEMKAGFDRVDDEFTALRAEMKAGFDALARQIERNAERVDRKFESLWRLMVWSYVSLIVPLLGLATTLVVMRA